MTIKDFTPKQELVMEVLVARRRLGEAFWTFRSRHEKVLRKLEEKQLVFVMHGIVDDTVRAGLTDKGIELFMSDSYTPPDRKAALTELTRLAEEFPGGYR